MRELFVGYYRVSTSKQGRSGLGVQAQKATVTAFVSGMGGSLIAEYVEQESGKLRERPQLTNALAMCRLRRATLVVAKLDRLARNAAFLLSLRDAGVDILACDLPSMNRMTVGIMAVVAEEEARMISERTKAALVAARARGVKLGTPRNMTEAARRAGAISSARVRSAQANQYAQDMGPILIDLMRRGHTSLSEIARVLNARGISTPRGYAWTPTAVARARRRADV